MHGLGQGHTFRTSWRFLVTIVFAAIVGALLWEALRLPTAPRRGTSETDRADAPAASPALRGAPQPAAPAADTPVTTQSKAPAASPAEAHQDDSLWRVSGVVLDETSVGVEGIPIVATTIMKRRGSAEGPPQPPVAWSGPDGRFAGWASTSRQMIEIGDAPGWVRPSPVFASDERDLVLRVQRAILLRGVVLDPSGRPATGAILIVQWPGDGGPRVEDLDESARFSASVPASAPRVELRALHSQLSGAEAEASLSVDPAVLTGDEIVLRFEPASVLQGRLEGPYGEPIADARLAVQRADRVDVLGKGAASGPDGRFICDRLSAGPHWVLVQPSSNAYGPPDPQRIDVPASGVRIVCPRGSTLRGRILDQDAGGFLVHWTWGRSSGYTPWPYRTAKTSPDGSFVLEGVADGDTLLFVRRPGDDRYARIERPRLDRDLEVRLLVGRTIAGRVVVPEGGLSGPLSIRLTTADAWIQTPVGPDGSFRLSGVPPGAYALGYICGARSGEFLLKAPIEAGTTDLVLTIPTE